jgi:hypothetical protein
MIPPSRSECLENVIARSEATKQSYKTETMMASSHRGEGKMRGN